MRARLIHPSIHPSIHPYTEQRCNLSYAPRHKWICKKKGLILDGVQQVRSTSRIAQLGECHVDASKNLPPFAQPNFFSTKQQLLPAMNSLTKLLPSLATAITTRSSRPILAACLHNTAIARQATSTSDQQPTWSPQSQRVGIIARKKGMSTFWDEWGARMPTTILQVPEKKEKVVHLIFVLFC